MGIFQRNESFLPEAAMRAATGGPLTGRYRHKMHLLLTWVDRLMRHPVILDAVEDVLGPDILCWNTNFIIKEAYSSDYIYWHQDATYGGLGGSDVMSVWIALWWHGVSK